MGGTTYYYLKILSIAAGSIIFLRRSACSHRVLQDALTPEEIDFESEISVGDYYLETKTVQGPGKVLTERKKMKKEEGEQYFPENIFENPKGENQ